MRARILGDKNERFQSANTNGSYARENVCLQSGYQIIVFVNHIIMEDKLEENIKEKLNAGRGIVKKSNLNSNKNTTLDQEDDNDRADDRARKAGY